MSKTLSLKHGTAHNANEVTAAKSFTLIELMVVTSQLCRDFFKRFICTDQYGCVRENTESAAHKNTPHHTCKASASCLPQANASCSNAALHTAEPCFIRSAFTLIELLVVIAIMAILAAILLPALQSARARGQAAGCTSNMRNLSVAVTTYANNYNDRLAPQAHTKYNKWFELLNKLVGRKGSTKHTISDIFRCPAVPPDLWNQTQRKSWKDSYKVTYGYSIFAGSNQYGTAAQYNTWHILSKIAKPSQRPIIIDYYNITTDKEALMNGFNDKAFGAPQSHYNTDRHRKLINVLNIGGNVETVRLPQTANFPVNRLNFAKKTW